VQKKYLQIQNLQIICRMLLYAILLFGSNKDIFFDKKKIDNFFKVAQNTFCFGIML